MMKTKITPLSMFVFCSLLSKFLYVKYLIMNSFGLKDCLTELSFLFCLILVISTVKNKLANYLLVIMDAVYTLLCLTTLLYFQYYHSIFTFQSIRQINQVGEISDGIFALLKIQYLWLFADYILLCFWPKIKKYFSGLQLSLTSKTTGWLSTFLLLFMGWSIFNSLNTINELSKFEKLGLLGFQFSDAVNGISATLTEEAHINAETLEKKRPGISKGTLQLHGIAKNKNIILIQLESMQNFLLNLKINGSEVTPNLNKLLKSAYYFPHFYTQVGKGNTSDAEFITNTSLYALGSTPMSSVVAGKTVPGLPRVLQENGYHTATFHANDVSFWNRNQLYRSLGFDEFFDKNYFGDNDIISYGTSDEVMYKKTVEKLADFKKSGKKFYAHIISLSSHFPFKLPDSKKKLAIQLPGQFDNSMVGSYLQAVSYADFAFGQLIENLKKAGLYDDSLIVIYGDHQGLQMKNQHDTQLVKEIFKRDYDNVLDHLNIPLIIKIPFEKNGKRVLADGGLVDIYPTISNLAGVDVSKQVIFGTDLINAKNNLIGIRFYAPTGTYINQSYRFSPGKTNDEGEIMSLDKRKKSLATKTALKNETNILDYMKISDQYVQTLKKD